LNLTLKWTPILKELGKEEVLEMKIDTMETELIPLFKEMNIRKESKK
jgi:hypothetical protein